MIWGDDGDGDWDEEKKLKTKEEVIEFASKCGKDCACIFVSGWRSQTVKLS